MYVRFNQQQSNAFFSGSLWSKTLPGIRMGDINYLIFGTEDFSFLHLMNCPNVIRDAVRTRNICVPTPRPPRVRPGTISFKITSIIIIIVSLPRSGGESDDISLLRSVMRMCLIMMLNLLLFPRFFVNVYAQAT